ncbi:transporter [Flavobacterium sp. JP2137]|uniref:transporter n=1 Tax=Flavobacterium sp. JP2137 TaxID=3414510 RepID=UPI003D2FD066
MNKLQGLLSLGLGLMMLCSGPLLAQQGDFWSRSAVEAGWGYQLPKAPTAGMEAKDYANFQSFYVGGRFELSDIWGLRGTYAYHAFEHQDDAELGLTIHKLTAEMTVLLMQAIQQQSSEPFEIMAHAGLGLSTGKSARQSSSDLMPNLQAGLMTIYQLGSQWSMHLDATYVFNFSQDLDYSGAAALSKSTTGNYFAASLGIAYKLR